MKITALGMCLPDTWIGKANANKNASVALKPNVKRRSGNEYSNSRVLLIWI